MSKTMDEVIPDAELFCDADEPLHIENMNLQDDEGDDEYYGKYERGSSSEDDGAFDDRMFWDNKNEYAHNLKRQNYTPKNQRLEKNHNKINLEIKDYGESGKGTRKKDKSDRATTEQVLDDKTRRILLKMMNSSFLSEISGCVATGKEANVYHALGAEQKEYAVKIYRTSISIFSNRDAYISGDRRYRRCRPTNNPRQLIPIWAEKEWRNLKRLQIEGLPVPEPLRLRNNVLVMKFLGNDGWPSPKLKDVQLTESKAREIYREVVVLMWKMYNDCKLVHADLSEYNMLYHQGRVYIIDVSQAVELNHENAVTFLKTDCTNITRFFKQKEVAVLSVSHLFDFITDISITADTMEQCLDALSERAAHTTETTNEDIVKEGVFQGEYIPRRLMDVKNAERDIIAAKSGALDRLNYGKLVGLKADLSGTVQRPEMLESNGADSSSGSKSDEEDNCEKTEKCIVNSARPKDETTEDKRNRKKAVKEAQAARRIEKKERKLVEKKKHSQKKSNIALNDKR